MTPGECLLRLALRRGAPRARAARPGSARPLGTLAGADPSPARWPGGHGGHGPRCHIRNVQRGRRWGQPASMASFPSHALRVREPSAGHRKFASSSSQGTKRIHRFGNKSGESVQLSKLRPRQAAALEDALFAKLNDRSANNDDRLKDPILHRSMGRKGLDWIRSISVPSSLSVGSSSGGNDGMREDAEAIAVTLRPPTLLHPQLEEVASNVARWVQEATAELLRDKSGEWFSDEGGEWSELRPDDIGVTVQISPSPTPPSSPSTKGLGRSNQGKALEQTAHVLAVYSCKGGVGKSTVATNLAYALSSLGGNVGLADLDVYGPSLPILVQPDDPTVRQSPPKMGEGMVEPIVHRGVKLMSLGYVSPDSGVPGSGPNSGAAVLRGPMAGRVVSQLLKGTNWGELDVLILDLPPGTGDVQLEVCQSLSLAGAVAVSTPSALAWADVRKGVEMFDAMGVPTVAVVENMAYFVCEGGGRHYPFGKSRSLAVDGEEGVDASSAAMSSAQHLPGPSRVFHLPVSSSVNESNDAGTPLCCDDDNTRGVNAEEERETFSRLAEAVATDLLLLRHGMMPVSMNARSGGGSNANLLTVTLDEAGELEFDVPFTQLSVDNAHRQFTVRLFSNEGGYQKNISGEELRRRDPRTGEVDSSAEINAPNATPRGGCGSGTSASNRLASMVQHHLAEDDGPDTDKDDGLFPATITKKGNYGSEVEWADGAKVIYSLGAIARAAGGKAPKG